MNQFQSNVEFSAQARIIRLISPLENDIVPERSSDPESDAINEAFREKIRDLFGKLVTTLIDGVSDQKSAEQFAKGLDYARRARDLALEATKAEPKTASAKTKGKTGKE